MINFKNYLVFILIFTGLNAFSQLKPFHEDYDWDSEPKYSVSEPDSTDLVIKKHLISHEFFFEGDEFYAYETTHKVIWLNSDDAIEKNNKVYLPAAESADLIVKKARVITKEGKVIDLDDSKILTAVDEESQQQYKYFTFEGVEKGSFVEYLFVKKGYPILKGRRVSLQSGIKQYDVQFHVFAPDHLEFMFKSYNDLQDVEIDTTIEDKAHWYIKLDTLLDLPFEAQAPYDVFRQFVIYKLDKNLANGASDLTSYADVSKNVFNYVYNKPEKSELKTIKKIAKKIGADKETDVAKKIRKIEDYIKRNYQYIDANAPQLNNMVEVDKNSYVGRDGVLKLYGLLFNHFGIDHQIVMTCEREYMKFDQKFESNNFLDEYLIYFPKIKEFMAPAYITSRLGLPPSELTGNYGLFIKEVSLNDYKTGIGKIKYIAPISHEKTKDRRIIGVSFNADDITSTHIKMDHEQSGYYAAYSQPIFYLLNEDDQNDFLETSLTYLNEDLDIENPEAFNTNPEDFAVKPFQIKSETTTDIFVEKAGDKYLFKVGELIGPQMEMYQEKKRTLPVYSQFKRWYYREITFEIPDGFEIKNLDDLKIDKTFEEDGDIQFTFKSEYKREGNKITIKIDEYYALMDIAPEIYEEYRATINGAADFNKVVLVMEAK